MTADAMIGVIKRNNKRDPVDNNKNGDKAGNGGKNKDGVGSGATPTETTTPSTAKATQDASDDKNGGKTTRNLSNIECHN